MAEDKLYLAAMNMDLQWFAAEDEGRTFEPTEATYRRAREEGRVAKSQELIAALGLLLPAIVIIFLAPWILRNCVEMLRFFFTRVNELDPLTDRLTAVVFANYFLRIVIPIFIVAVAAALFSNLIQVGFLFATKPLEPDFSKVLPKFGRYFGRIFSVEGLFNFGKSLFKMIVIGSVAYVNISSEFHRLVNLQTSGLWEGVTLIANIAARLLIITALLLLVLSVPDIFFQRWQFRQSLKMTREAAKEEVKQDEGDHEMRRRLKNRYQDMLSRNVHSAVSKADVVITNPTHYSVALMFDWAEYNAGRINGPTVVAKGEDELALKIREIAKQNGIPVERHPSLARTIYAETELGEQIPYRYLEVVGVVLREFFLYDEKKAKARTSAGRKGA
jgi:flagellar biosynthetic protein FlhB